jgi:glycosyltransferase involved in cell wall biosynthesis
MLDKNNKNKFQSTAVNIGLIQYWFADKGGMEQHVLALARALKHRQFNIRIYVAYPIDTKNEYIRHLFDQGIPVTGPSSWLKELDKNKQSCRSFIARIAIKLYCIYFLPIMLLLLGFIKGKSFRNRAYNTWQFMSSLDSNKLMLLSSAIKLCISHCHQPLDIVHVNGFRIEVGWAIRWADQFSVPSVYTEHSTVTDWLDFEGMDIEAVKLADVVASVSMHACDELRCLAKLRNVELVKHILPCIDAEDDSRLSSSIRNLICVAELKPIKRVIVLVEAFSEVLETYPHLILHLVGDGPNRIEICDYIDKAGISRQVCLHGHLPNHEVINLLKESDLMILPSISEGLPVSMLEALANAVPVIATDKGGIQEIIRHGENGFLFSSGDQKCLTNTIVAALEKGTVWKKISSNARQSYEDYDNNNFSAIDEVNDLYEQAIFNRQGAMTDYKKNNGLNKNGYYKLSIIIPTHNPVYLDQTLSGLEQQIETRFEVLIIENGSSSLTLMNLISKYSEAMNIRYYQTQKAGLNRARNVGVSKSKTEIIAFIDDDAVPDSNWTKQVLHCHRQHPDAGVIGGPVMLSFLTSEPAWLHPPFRDALSEVDYGDDSRCLRYPQWLAGTNFTFRKKIYTRAGEFLEDLGPAVENNFNGCNDETEFLNRAEKHGNPGIYYNASMIVEHLIPDERVALGSLEKRFSNQGYSDLLLTSKHEHDIPWRSWWKFLYHALDAQKWHKNLDNFPENLSSNIRNEYFKYLVMARIAFLEGMLHFILTRVATSQDKLSLSHTRSRFQKHGRNWVKKQIANMENDDEILLFKKLSCLMLKRRYTWSLSDHFTEQCVFGRIFFFIEIKDYINKHLLFEETTLVVDKEDVDDTKLLAGCSIS